MDLSQYFEIIDDYAVFRPLGEASVEQVGETIASAISWARDQGIPKLLVVTLGWAKLRSPNLADRYFMVKRWAMAATGAVKVAVVARPDLIDPEKFGVTVANNSGFCADIFSSEDEALFWLRGSNDHGRRNAA